MRIRDALMVLIAIGGLLFGWLQEGSLHLQRSFTVTMTDSDVLIHTYPKPVVVDLHGDGKPVLLACPRSDILAIYPTHFARRNFENVFVHLGVQKQVQVYSTIVGFAAGKIGLLETVTRKDSPSVESPAAAIAKERVVIAVVTDDYRIEMLDANLQTMWSTSIVPLNEAGILLHHAAITLLPERIYAPDHGTVVVSVNVAGANGTEHVLVSAFAADSGELRWRHIADEYRPAYGTFNGKDEEEDTSDEAPLPPQLDKTSDDAGKSGNNNTKNATAAVTSPVATEKNTFAADNKLRMSPSTLAAETTDYHWTKFREAIIGAMPHVYSHSWNEEIQPHVFFHAKNRAKKQPGNHLHGAGSSNNRYKDRRVHLDTNDVGELGERATKNGGGSSSSRRGGATSGTSTSIPLSHHPNVVVLHRKDAVEVLHLYTGKRITRVYPLHKNTVYHDVDDDFHLDAVSNLFGSHSTMHHRHGVDVTVDCLGVVTSNVPQGQDAMYNATICDTEGLLSGLKFVNGFLHGDEPTEHPQLDPLSLIGSRNVASTTTHGVTPVVVQHHLRKGRDLFKVQRHAIFMIDSGLVTCLDPVTKRVMWRVQTEATFPDLRKAEEEEVSIGLHSEEDKMTRLRKFPHLAKYSLHQHDVTVHSAKQRYREADPFVLAVGEKHLVSINARSGEIAETIDLEQAPVAPSMIVDVNGDGVNDVLVFSANTIYGFVVQPRSATSTVAMLMLLMVGVLVTLVVAREMREHDGEAEILPGGAFSGSGADGHHAAQHRGPHKVKRSTD
ncbi:membrane-associated protein, putative [Bodo saltans]|uniref:Membrane-associated protein, putative n=1 Tax=Bodo saltans TaxID=75058 RepID=A0A0S4JLI3_BODSA|nr:membrane-associated protein, putative [Bodo saltans]|eukprot:CUG90107.1 membrane-associated protein, putative [Bodo saltans]